VFLGADIICSAVKGVWNPLIAEVGFDIICSAVKGVSAFGVAVFVSGKSNFGRPL